MRLRNKDIAEMLGISTAAVSLALNGKPGVSDETRRRVLEVVNASAQESMRELRPAQARPSGGVVAFVVYKGNGYVDDSMAFFVNLIETAQLGLAEHGLTLTTLMHRESPDMSAQLNDVRVLNPVGIILQATELDREALAAYKSLGIPIVLIDGYFDLDDTDAVSLNHIEISLQLVSHLAQRGHRDIGYLQCVPDIENLRHRRDGFWMGVRSFGLRDASHPFVEMPRSVEGAYDVMAALLREPPEGWRMPTAFLADNDLVTLGAMRALKEAGYDIPGDVSIVSYSDVRPEAMPDPAVTVAKLNLYDLGRVAALVLVERLSHPDGAQSVTFVGSQLVCRESVRDLTR